MNKLIVRKAAVLGAGVMGAQIAAHLANANVPVVLFGLPAKEGDKNGVVKKALDGLKKLDPAPLSGKAKLKFIDAANYDEHLPLLAECDLVITIRPQRIVRAATVAIVGSSPRYGVSGLTPSNRRSTAIRSIRRVNRTNLSWPRTCMVQSTMSKVHSSADGLEEVQL